MSIADIEDLRKNNPEEIFHRVFSTNAGDLMTAEEMIETMRSMNNANRANFFIRLSDQSYVILKDLLSDQVNDNDEHPYKTAQDMLNANNAMKVKDDYQKAMLEFVRLDTLPQRLSDVDVIKYEYQNILSIWCVAAFSVIEREDGVVSKVDYQVSELTYDRAEAQELLQMQKEAITTLSNSELLFISIIDRETGASRVIQSRRLINTDKVFDFDYSMRREAAHLLEADRQEFLKKANLAAVNKTLKEKVHFSIEVFLQLPDSGRFRRVSYHFSYNEKYPKYILSTTEDITDRYIYDSITGRKNFNGFRMDCMYEFNRFDPEQYVVINFNIVNFKAANTIYGYEAGNWLLDRVFATLLESEVPFISVGRENADNFFCLCRKSDYDYDALKRLCKMKIRDNEGLSESLELFCGVYPVCDKGESLSTICDKARIARRNAEREIGENSYVLNETDKQRYLDEAFVAASVSNAISKNEIVVYYQPLVDAVSGKVVSAEALVRWQHPQKGLIQPNMFVPALERTGQIVEMDLCVGRQVVQLQKKRFLSGEKTVPISINVSRYDFLQDKYMRHALGSIHNEPDVAEAIRIEITESGIINISGSGQEFLNEMRGLGIQIMIDDFGTGYSSLASVIDRPCDFIKLDMLFARHIGVDKRTEILIRAAIETAHNLGVKVVAEGVETKAQYEFLRDNGCDYIQGYYFSKPLPEKEFIKLLEQEEA